MMKEQYRSVVVGPVGRRTPLQAIQNPPTMKSMVVMQSLSMPARAFCSYCMEEVVTKVVIEVQNEGIVEKVLGFFSCCKSVRRVITHFCSGCDNVVTKIHSYYSLRCT
jgi:hypothetical protein